MNLKHVSLTLLGFFMLFGLTNFVNPVWQSKFVQETNGKLVHAKDSKGNQIPDFGKVGYHKGAIKLPDVTVVKTISAPISGDAGELIQTAIDEVAKMPLKINGFRGAILLKKGIYRIPGKINIQESGIVIRGEGTGDSGTILVASGTGQRTLVNISGKRSSIEIKGTRVSITDTFVPVGSTTFQIENTGGFKVGDAIIMFRPGTDNWVHDLKMDQIEERPGTKQWKGRDYDLKFERVITAIEGNRIHIDQPVVMEMDQKYGGGTIYKITDERISEIGIENILFKSDFTSETDEDHGWYAIQFQNCKNGWVRNVVSKYFGNGCVNMNGGAKYITVTDSKCLEAKSIITGGRRYSFNINGQMCLVMNCEATEGRHDYVTGARVCGPNVFYNCKAGNTHSDIGPHHRWSVGTLYDNITTDGEINIQDRGNYGSGHGWAGANQVLWNCKVKKATVQNPWVSANNYAIGVTGEKDPGRFKERLDGEWEGLNQPGLKPQSLYIAQKNAVPTIVGKHHLPSTDRQYRTTTSYIEEIPVKEYNWASDKAYEDFQDLKYGVRIHWGLYSAIQQQKESWPFLKLPNKEKQTYLDLGKTWNPAGFNADSWMNLFSEAGMKMFAFTSKHHEGFSMFDTKTRVKQRINYTAPGGPVIENCDVAFSIMETPFKRDVVKELCDAAHKKNIKIDLYFSHPDWYDADFRPYVWHPLQVPSAGKLAVRNNPPEPEGAVESHYGTNGPIMVPDPTPESVDRMMKRHREQLKELLTNYGKIDLLCLDMWLGPAVWPQLRETLLQLRKLQPNVMLRARGIGNYGDYYTPEGFVPGSKENTSVPWFVIYPLGRTFSYETDSKEHKGAKWIIHNVIDCAAKGGNFMVGIGPDENGIFHPTVIEQLKQAGQWLKVNGNGIYATRARDAENWKEGDSIRYTRSKDAKTIFAHCFEWPGKQLVLKTVTAKANSKIFLLGNDTPLKWEKIDGKGLIINLPQAFNDRIPENQRLAYSFRIIAENN